MTSFFAAIVARAVGAPAPLQPRRAQRFEHLDAASAMASRGPIAVDDTTISAPRAPAALQEPPPPPPDPARPPAARRTGQDVSARQNTPRRPSSEASAAPLEPAFAVVESTTRDDLSRALQAARDAGERAARLTDDQVVTRPADRRPAPSRSPQPAPTIDRDVATTPAPPASADPDVEPATPPEPPTRLDAITPAVAWPESPAAQQMPPPAPGSPVSPPIPQAGVSRPPGRRAELIDLAALLREQVFSALTERGSVPVGVTPVVATASTPRAPRAGTASVRAEGVRIDQPLDDAPSSGDVHVHIGRVSVTQAPPPTAPRVPRSETVRRSVDHQAYLARRRERG